MNSKEISIIVPIYNTEKFLPEAIESLMKQTLKNIEIILVNDGSTDGSRKICEKYANIDSRIIIINKENGGLADARNSGMKIASGKYIMFLDADDTFELDSCESMYKVIEENNADYVIGNYQMTDEDGTRWPNTAFDTEKYKLFEINISDYRKSFFVMNSMACNKIYRRQFLVENDITFKVPAPAEDAFFTSLCYINAKKAFYSEKVMYLYRNTSNSLSKKCTPKYFKGIEYSYRKIYEAFEENGKLGYYRYVYAKINAYIICQLIDSEMLNDQEKIDYLKEFKWYFDLRNKLKIEIVHETLKKVVELIQKEDYENVIIEMNRLKEYRKSLPDHIKKRMSFPNFEDYLLLEKYEKEFK